MTAVHLKARNVLFFFSVVNTQRHKLVIRIEMRTNEQSVVIQLRMQFSKSHIQFDIRSTRNAMSSIATHNEREALVWSQCQWKCVSISFGVEQATM